jgi:cyclic pyranopterin phosphate synthase
MTDRIQDRAGSALRLSVTGQCNLRCSYCHAGSGNGNGTLLPPLKELFFLTRLVVETFHVVKVRLTGGEPLIRPDIDEIVEACKKFPSVGHVGVTTNGQLLETWAERLARAGAGSVNVSLDSLRPDRYRAICGGGSLERVLAGMAAARRAGISTIKANCVVRAGVNDDEIEPLIDFALAEGVEVRFLELMSFDGSSEQFEKQFVPAGEILRRIKERFSPEPLEGRQEQTAKMFGVRRGGVEGVVGIIGSSDGSMCKTCNRIRITADGRLRRCLKDPFEIDLRGMAAMGVPEDRIRERLRAYMDMKSRPAPLVGAGSMMRIGG